MNNAFIDKSAKILIIDESGGGRQMLSDVVRGFGYQDVVVVASGQDAVGVLETEPIDWLLMPVMRRQPVNALHLLCLIAHDPLLRNVRASVLFEEEDDPLLDAAFSLGMMSCHPRTYAREELHEAVDRLLKTILAQGGRPVLVAADYLRQRLLKSSRYAALETVERALLNLFPGSATLLLKLGETQLLAGDAQRGAQTLRQAALIDEHAKTLAEALMQKVLGRRIPSRRSEEARQNALGISTCVLVDPDTAVLGSVGALLADVGVPRVEIFEDGDAAWAWLESNPEPCLILQEWRIPGMPGPLLLQRIRQNGFIATPVVVTSSVIKPQEAPLLREMSVDNVIPKPFSQQLFFKNLIWTLQQNRAPTEQKSLERKMRRHLELKQVGEAERVRLAFMANSRIPSQAKALVNAEFAFHAGRYREARDQAIEALRLAGDSLLLLNLIGKCLLKLGDHAAAVKFLEKANHLSPLNVEHLCNMAIGQFEAGQKDSAAFLLSRARALDPSNRLVNELDCQQAIMSGEIDRARGLMQQLTSLSRVVAYMNNRAVWLIRSGRYDEGIALYHRTIECLPGEGSDLHDAVGFNLGLAFARYGELDQALKLLRPIATCAPSPRQRRAASLAARLADARKSGLPLALNWSGPDEGLPEALPVHEHLERRTAMAPAFEVRRGDVCLKDIFEVTLTDEVVELLKGMPTLKMRNAIDRSETNQRRP